MSRRFRSPIFDEGMTVKPVGPETLPETLHRVIGEPIESDPCRCGCTRFRFRASLSRDYRQELACMACGRRQRGSGEAT
jgi:hypothetical protein